MHIDPDAHHDSAALWRERAGKYLCLALEAGEAALPFERETSFLKDCKDDPAWLRVRNLGFYYRAMEREYTRFAFRFALEARRAEGLGRL